MQATIDQSSNGARHIHEQVPCAYLLGADGKPQPAFTAACRNPLQALQIKHGCKRGVGPQGGHSLASASRLSRCTSCSYCLMVDDASILALRASARSPSSCMRRSDVVPSAVAAAEVAAASSCLALSCRTWGVRLQQRWRSSLSVVAICEL